MAWRGSHDAAAQDDNPFGVPGGWPSRSGSAPQPFTDLAEIRSAAASAGKFQVETDPEFETKLADVMGLYLDPPNGVLLLCIDENSQIQELNRTQPAFAHTAGLPARIHDYILHGTTSLFAALEVASGNVQGRCYLRHTHVEFITFLKVPSQALSRPRIAPHLRQLRHPQNIPR